MLTLRMWTLPTTSVTPRSRAADSAASSSSSARALRPGTSLVASDRRLPYRSPVSELVRPDSHTQPTTAPARSATRVTSSGLPSEPDTRLRCNSGSVTASSPKEIRAISISYPTSASRSSRVAGRTRSAASAGTGRLPGRPGGARPERAAAAARAAGLLQLTDGPPAPARADGLRGAAGCADVPAPVPVRPGVDGPVRTVGGRAGRDQVPQRAGAAQHAGADVVVEPRPHGSDRQPQPGHRLLQRDRL